MENMKLSECTDLLVRGVNVIEDIEDGIEYYDIKMTNIVENKILITDEDKKESGRRKQIQLKKLQKGDILIPVRGTFNDKVIIFDLEVALPCIVSHHFWIIRPNNQFVTSFYLLYFLLSCKEKMNTDERNILAKAQGISINGKMLDNLEVPIIPLEEQSKMESFYRFSQQMYNSINNLTTLNQSFNETAFSIEDTTLDKISSIITNMEVSLKNMNELSNEMGKSLHTKEIL